MRVLVTLALILIFLEAILALAFWGGWVWIGGWPGAVILVAAVFLLLAVPWIGDLHIDHDSLNNQTQLRASWWGRLTLQTKPSKQITVRVLFIPWRKKLEAQKAKAITEHREKRTEEGWQLLGLAKGNFNPVVRTLLAVLQAAHELLWESREFKVYVQAPTQIESADRAIAGLAGARTLGPVDLNCGSTGKRRVRVHYQIRLLRATLTLLYMSLQSRPRVLASLWKSARKEAAKERLSTEQKEAE